MGPSEEEEASLQISILAGSHAPLVPIALAGRADYCALLPGFDVALLKILILFEAKFRHNFPNLWASALIGSLYNDHARSDCECAVLHSLTQAGASDWLQHLLALPVPHLQQTRSSESFRCRLQYELIIPIFQEESQCPYC